MRAERGRICMDLYNLKQFVTVCQEKSITKAAEILFTTQPSLSRTISEMEKDHGCKMFERKGNQILINENGKLFYDFAVEVLSSYEQLCGKLNRKKEADDYLRICYNNIFFSQFLISKYTRNNNKVIAKYSDAQAIKNLIVSEQYDLAVTDFAIKYKALDNLLIMKNNLYVSIPKNHPLAANEQLTIENLDNEQLIYLNNQNLKSLDRFISLLQTKAPRHSVLANLDPDSFLALRDELSGLYFVNSLERFAYDNPQRVLLKLDEPQIESSLYIIYKFMNRYKVNDFIKFVSGFMHKKL